MPQVFNPGPCAPSVWKVIPVKKRSYRAVAVNNVRIEKLSEQVAGRRVVVGIDAAKTSFVATLMDDERQVLLTVKWEHPRETRDFVKLLGALGARTVEAAMEPTGSYGRPVLELLRGAGTGVFRVSPKRVHDAAEMFDGVPSQHDAKCAAIIARLHCDGFSSVWPQQSEEARNLSAAVKTAARAHDMRQRMLNELEGWLAAFWPEVLLLLEHGGATLTALLREYGSPARIAAQHAEARVLMRRVGTGLLKAAKIEAVLLSAQESTGAPMTSGEVNALQKFAQEIENINARVREHDAELAQLATANEPAGRMAKVVGKVTAAVLVSEAGDPRSFTSTSAYVKNLGLNLKECSSGKKRGQLAITKRGSGCARRYLFLAALRLIRTDPVTGSWYQAKVLRDGGRSRMKGVVAVMRKLARALWHVARGAEFDAQKLFDTRRLPALQSAQQGAA
jgi:transposase